MSPTTDDLRILLEERAGGGPDSTPHDEAVGARLVGVRARIHHRRHVRAAVAASAVALTVGSASLATAQLHRPAVQPAHVTGRPPVTTLAVESGSEPAAVTLDPASDLRFVVRCSDHPDVSAVVIVDGRATVAARCTGSPVEQTLGVRGDAASALAPGLQVTVGLHLASGGTGKRPLAIDDPTARAHATLAVYSGSRPITIPLPGGTGTPDPAVLPDLLARHPLLAGLGRAVSKDFGTRGLRVVPGALDLSFALSCSSSPGGPAFQAVISVNGHVLGWTGCEGQDPSGVAGFSGPEGSSREKTGFWTPRGVRVGRPVLVQVRLTTSAGKEAPASPDLARTLPGATVALAVRGTPYVPAALLGSTGRR